MKSAARVLIFSRFLRHLNVFHRLKSAARMVDSRGINAYKRILEFVFWSCSATVNTPMVETSGGGTVTPHLSETTPSQIDKKKERKKEKGTSITIRRPGGSGLIILGPGWEWSGVLALR
ncbi:hypothetical protein L2E82_11242 [Cichorium intybus]|uniref:Uncharacterized protein n=1 Tax=Cichorium intybus TaxID=13427 RepID=A0ACB9GDV2_CICIN|nr:hypothetical protein L2E82_11242 [Cichorium intybus]